MVKSFERCGSSIVICTIYVRWIQSAQCSLDDSPISALHDSSHFLCSSFCCVHSSDINKERNTKYSYLTICQCMVVSFNVPVYDCSTPFYNHFCFQAEKSSHLYSFRPFPLERIQGNACGQEACNIYLGSTLWPLINIVIETLSLCS